MNFNDSNALPAAIRVEVRQARRAQRDLYFNAFMASACLVVGIVLWDWWLGAYVLFWLIQAQEAQGRRNDALHSLHRLGALRWIGATASEFGAALPSGCSEATASNAVNES